VFLRRNLHRRPRVMAFPRRSLGAPGLVVIDFTLLDNSLRSDPADP